MLTQTASLEFFDPGAHPSLESFFQFRLIVFGLKTFNRVAGGVQRNGVAGQFRVALVRRNKIDQMAFSTRMGLFR